MENINTQKNENEIKQEKTPKEKTFFILKIVGNVVFYLIIIFLLLFSIMNINAGSRNGGFPNIFGRGFLSVQTDSMERDNNSSNDLKEWADYKIGGIKKGDLVLVKTFKEKDFKKLKVGDVITFKTEINGQIALNTHRIVYINAESDKIYTQGDNRAEIQSFDKTDPFSEYNGSLVMSGAAEEISVSDIKGVVTGVKKGAGKVLDNIQDNWLFYFVLPVLAFLLFEVFMVIKNIIELKNAKKGTVNDSDVAPMDIEATKEELRKQILAEMQAQQAALTKEKEEPAVEEVVEEKEEPVVEEVVEEKEEPVVEEVVEEKKEPVKKPTPRKTTAKKTTAKTSSTTKKSASSTAKKTTTTKKSTSSTTKKTTSKTKKTEN